NHVATKPNEHLRRCLPADAAIDIRLARKETAVRWIVPGVSDRIAHEDDALFVLCGWREQKILFEITIERGPVVQLSLRTLKLRLHLSTIRCWRRHRRLTNCRYRAPYQSHPNPNQPSHHFSFYVFLFYVPLCLF